MCAGRARGGELGELERERGEEGGWVGRYERARAWERGGERAAEKAEGAERKGATNIEIAHRGVRSAEPSRERLLSIPLRPEQRAKERVRAERETGRAWRTKCLLGAPPKTPSGLTMNNPM